MTDPIKAALGVAAARMCVCDGECFETRHGMMNGPCEKRPTEAAPVIAAFLRALPEGEAVFAPWPHTGVGSARSFDTLANAVQRAGGGDAA